MIPEDMIKQYLDWLMTSSTPGAILHNLVMVSAPNDAAVTALGLLDEKQLKVDIAAIAPDASVDAEQFVATTIGNEKISHHRENEQVVFAAIGHEAFRAPMDELGRKLLREGRRLFDHPEAAEATTVYGVCRDGRRWRGRHWLTGPRAGEFDELTLLVGRFDLAEGPGRAATRAMLRLVGLIP